MGGCPARHVPCGAHHDRGLRGERNPHAQLGRVGALLASRVYVRRRGASEAQAEAAKQGREVEEFPCAGSVYSSSTQYFYLTA